MRTACSTINVPGRACIRGSARRSTSVRPKLETTIQPTTSSGSSPLQLMFKGRQHQPDRPRKLAGRPSGSALSAPTGSFSSVRSSPSRAGSSVPPVTSSSTPCTLVNSRHNAGTPYSPAPRHLQSRKRRPAPARRQRVDERLRRAVLLPACGRGHYFTTRFTSLPLTTMTFTTVLPAMRAATFSSASAAALHLARRRFRPQA